jgi:hypothetical protein
LQGRVPLLDGLLGRREEESGSLTGDGLSGGDHRLHASVVGVEGDGQVSGRGADGSPTSSTPPAAMIMPDHHELAETKGPGLGRFSHPSMHRR